jgi:hypothetical protein
LEKAVRGIFDQAMDVTSIHSGETAFDVAVVIQRRGLQN